MRRIAAVCLGTLLLVAGCPSQEQIPSVVTALAAGTYTGTVDCTATPTDLDEAQKHPTMTVEVTDQMQLSVWGAPYYEGAFLDLSDQSKGFSGGVTINTINNNGNTLTADAAGSVSTAAATYATTHSVTLVQVNDTQLQATWVISRDSAGAEGTYATTCGGTLTK